MKTKNKYYIAGGVLLVIVIMMTFTFRVMAAKASREKQTVVAETSEGMQTIEAEVTASGYPDITVEANKPVRINFKVSVEDLNACNNEINLPEWNITQKLSAGDNYIEFTPTETGAFNYSCWMGMIGAKITVIDQGSGDTGATAATPGVNKNGGCNMMGGSSNNSSNGNSTRGSGCH